MFSNYQELASLETKELRRIKSWATLELKRRRKEKKKTQQLPNTRFYRMYVLLLKGGKYYVGITSRKVKQRAQEHLDGKGALWTKKYAPIGILEQEDLGFMTESEAAKIENAKTHKMIAEHGVENVRGGGLCQVSQSQFNKQYQASCETFKKNNLMKV